MQKYITLELAHIWIGSKYDKGWTWNNRYEELSVGKSDDTNYPPWAPVSQNYKKTLCLNLDRSNHNQPHFYGIHCKSKQAFSCVSPTGKHKKKFQFTNTLSYTLKPIRHQSFTTGFKLTFTTLLILFYQPALI